LLQATNRLAEAEPLMRRALAIDEQSYGQDHPNVARDLNNLAVLLRDLNRLKESIPLIDLTVEIYRNFQVLNGVQYPHWNNVRYYQRTCVKRLDYPTWNSEICSHAKPLTFNGIKRIWHVAPQSGELGATDKKMLRAASG
jgi:tetratricopeptide (TPR) repeat protein